MSIWDLANAASTDVETKRHADTIFCCGSREIEINGSRPYDAYQVLTQFGPLAKSISIKGNGNAEEDMWILRWLSALGRAKKGNLEILRFWNCKLNFFSLAPEKQLPLYEQMRTLKEISMTSCDIEYFRCLYANTVQTLEKIFFNSCTMDKDTQDLFTLEFPELRKLALVKCVLPVDLTASTISHLCRSSPRIHELKICEYSLDVSEMAGIQKLVGLQNLEVGTNKLFGSDWFEGSQLQRLRVVGGLPTESAKLQLNDLPVIESLKELVFLRSEDTNYWQEPGGAKFNLDNEFNQDLDFPNLEKFTISTSGDFNILNCVIPHMRNIKFFSFLGLSFDTSTFRKLLCFAPELEIVNIIAMNLPSLEDLKKMCEAKENNWILSLRRGRHTIMRAHHRKNSVIFYPRAEDENVEQFELGPDTDFGRAVRIAHEKKYIEIDDEKIFQIYFYEDCKTIRSPQPLLYYLDRVRESLIIV